MLTGTGSDKIQTETLHLCLKSQIKSKTTVYFLTSSVQMHQYDCGLETELAEFRFVWSQVLH